MKRPATTPPEEPHQRHRRHLLEAAYALIAENGFEGLRTRDIAARAGVNISTLHYYFGTKEALVEAVVEHVVAKFVERPGDGGPTGAGAPLTLRGHFESAWATFQRNENLEIVLQELAVRARRDPRTRAVFRNMFKQWTRVVEEAVRAEVDAGTVRADVDPREAAVAATCFIMGAMTQLGINAKAFDFGSVSRQLASWLAAEPSAGNRRR